MILRDRQKILIKKEINGLQCLETSNFSITSSLHTLHDLPPPSGSGIRSRGGLGTLPPLPLIYSNSENERFLIEISGKTLRVFSLASARN